MFKVCKFGGSVLHTSSNIIKILDIISNQNQKTIIIFSAFYQQTDALIKTAELANQGLEYYPKLLEIVNFHKNITFDLELKIDFLTETFDKIFEVYNKVFTNKNLCPQILDEIMSFGEKLSTLIIFNFFSHKINVTLVNAEEIIKTDSNFGAAKVNFEETIINFNKALFNITQKYIILGGFIGSNQHKQVTTLGRNGSDYTAAIISNIIKANCLEIWKDVDGIYTADPKIVKNAKFINMVSYSEMSDLAFFGNKVIAMTAMHPIVENNIAVYIKNIQKPLSIGTIISPQTNYDHKIKGVTKIDNCILFEIVFLENIAIVNFSERINKALSKNNIHILFYKVQEYAICIKQNESHATELALNIEFSDEIANNNIIINKTINQSIIAIISYDINYISQINKDLFLCLADYKIEVNNIGKNNSTTSITLVVDTKVADKTINVIHAFLIKEDIVPRITQKLI